MIINSSNLALRFYAKDGWTLDILNSCTKRGFVKMPYPEDKNQYFILNVGGAFNAKKLLSYATKVIRTFDDYPEMTDLEFIESKNW